MAQVAMQREEGMRILLQGRLDEQARELEGKKRTAELVLDPVDAVTQPESLTERADTKIRLLSSSAFA